MSLVRDMVTPVPDLKMLANFAPQRFGGKPSARRYRHDSSDLWVDVVKCDGSPEGPLDSYATVGMSGFNNDFEIDGLPLRVELTIAVRADWTLAANALAGAAFNVATGEYVCKPGIIYPNLLDGYDREVTTPHGLIWWPFAWDAEWDSVVEDGVHIEWLTVIPVTPDEAQYFADHDAEALIDIFEKQQPDLYDLSRESVALTETSPAE